MGETSCIVFVNGNVLVYRGQGKLVLPESLKGFPFMLNNEDGTKVLIKEPVEHPQSRIAMRECILEVIEEYRKVGIPRIEFPRWNEMLIYPVVPESADEEYWCFEQVIDSFLDLYGPEFII